MDETCPLCTGGGGGPVDRLSWCVAPASLDLLEGGVLAGARVPIPPPRMTSRWIAWTKAGYVISAGVAPASWEDRTPWNAPPTSLDVVSDT